MTLCNACGLRNAKRSGHGGTMSEEGVPSPSGGSVRVHGTPRGNDMSHLAAQLNANPLGVGVVDGARGPAQVGGQVGGPAGRTHMPNGAPIAQHPHKRQHTMSATTQAAAQALAAAAAAQDAAQKISAAHPMHTVATPVDPGDHQAIVAMPPTVGMPPNLQAVQNPPVEYYAPPPAQAAQVLSATPMPGTPPFSGSQGPPAAATSMPPPVSLPPAQQPPQPQYQQVPPQQKQHCQQQ